MPYFETNKNDIKIINKRSLDLEVDTFNFFFFLRISNKRYIFMERQLTIWVWTQCLVHEASQFANYY